MDGAVAGLVCEVPTPNFIGYDRDEWGEQAEDVGECDFECRQSGIFGVCILRIGAGAPFHQFNVVVGEGVPKKVLSRF